MSQPQAPVTPSNFIRQMIDDDLRTGKYSSRVVTRFPPEPNGYLHIGHAKSICLNFGIARDYPGGKCHLRFDDTNPAKEEVEYVESIQRDVKWLGFDWGDNLFYASDYFDQLYDFAVRLIQKGKAYVCDLTEEVLREYRGSLTEPGKESPYRNRSVEENLELFAKMRAGEFKDGERTLRAKIDMAAANMKMRDPLLYRIRHVHHDRTGDKWCIYPMYDYAHCLSDAIEKITHSLCTLEFENNRELYDWIVKEVGFDEPPEQTEFARLNINYMVMSKRKLLELVENNDVNGWDDPRLPTISGLRRRGYTPEAIQNFCESVGIAKSNSTVDIAQLEFCIRDDLNFKAPRVLCVLKPLKVVITNYPDGQREELDGSYYPHDVPKEGSRKIPFSKELYIEQSDFMEEPPKNYYRLSPGNEVRLRYGYIIKCEDVVKDNDGNIVELHCSYDPATKSGEDTSGKTVKGTIHWVSAKDALDVEVRLYDRLFDVDDPDSGADYKDNINQDSLEVVTHAKLEPNFNGEDSQHFQFERHGYFCIDSVDSKDDALVFNRTVSLRDSWAKKAKQPDTSKTEKKESKKEEKITGSGTPKVGKTRPEKKGKPKRSDTDPVVAERIQSYVSQHGLSEEDAKVLAEDDELDGFFNDALKHNDGAKTLANWIVNELQRELKELELKDLPFGAQEFAELTQLIDDDVITGKIAKSVYQKLLESGGSPKAIVEKEGLKQISDPKELEPLIDTIIQNNPGQVEGYRSGKNNLFGFFVGQVMKKTNGQANPVVVNELLKTKLDG